MSRGNNSPKRIPNAIPEEDEVEKVPEVRVSATNPFSMVDEESDDEDPKKSQHAKDTCQRNVKCNLPVVVPTDQNPLMNDDIDLGTLPLPIVIKRLHDDGKVIRHDALKGSPLHHPRKYGRADFQRKKQDVVHDEPNHSVSLYLPKHAQSVSSQEAPVTSVLVCVHGKGELPHLFQNWKLGVSGLQAERNPADSDRRAKGGQ